MNLKFCFGVFLLAFVANCYAEVGYDHCLKNNFNNNSTYMQFTKEMVAEEFATLGSFKSLHCCAKGYRTIEWYKDNKPYPWPSESSSFILYPDAANQTIYTRSITAADKGNYSCRLRNDTHLSTNNVNLEIFERSPDKALINFISENKSVQLGSHVRLYCEAFVGHVSLPDAQSKIHWRYTAEGKTTEEPHHGKEQHSDRENGAVIGVILDIPKVQRHHFGKYVCNVGLPGSDEYIKKSSIISDSGVSMVEDTRWMNSSNALVMAVIVATLCALLVILFAKIMYYRNQLQNNSEVCRKMAEDA